MKKSFLVVLATLFFLNPYAQKKKDQTATVSPPTVVTTLIRLHQKTV